MPRSWIEDPPIIYMSLDGYDRKRFLPELTNVQGNADRIVQALKISSPTAAECRVKCSVNHETPDTVNATAARLSAGQYEIAVETGLVVHAWAYSRLLERFPAELLSWADEARVAPAEVPKGMTTPTLLAEYAFYIMCQFVFYHELAHVVLGHLDYLSHKISLSVIREIPASVEMDLSDLRAIEADADRQALLWSAAEYESTLGRDGLGIGLRFPTQEAAWDYFGFVVTLLCILFQNANATGTVRSHPDANERSFVMYGFIDEYLERSGKSLDQRARFFRTACQSRVEYARKLGLVGGWSLEGNLQACAFMSGVGRALDRMGVRKFQMKAASKR